MVINYWECSEDTCTVRAELDNQLGYDIVINAICDGNRIIKIELKPYVEQA